MKICFAASGGGHLRQLLELKDLWSICDAYFVSEDSVLLRTFEGPARRRVVSPFMLGEFHRRGRLGVLRRIARNIVESLRHVRAERPDVVISTGAGSAFFTLLFGRLFGAKVVTIETFSRSQGLSKFARVAGPISNQRVLQTPVLSRFWPRAPVFDPIKPLPPAKFDKADLIFLTVGATLPFDRMVLALDRLRAEGRVMGEVLYQVGRGGARPRQGEVVEELANHELAEILKRARIVICHGGSGSIIPALQAGCHVIAFARRQSFNEHFDDHQLDLTQSFETRGVIQLAWDADSLARAIDATATRPVTRMTSDMTELAGYLAGLIRRWSPQAIPARNQPA